jgi:hypothetical protein
MVSVFQRAELLLFFIVLPNERTVPPSDAGFCEISTCTKANKYFPIMGYHLSAPD